MEDDLRWQTSDGESPSQFGCFGTVFVLAMLLLIGALAAGWRYL